MILGPLLLLTGVLLRLPFHFFFPQQLAAFAQNPTLMTASYNCFLAGILFLWPSIVVLAQLIGRTRPGWARWGGMFVVFGLFARTFHAGADYMAFQVARVQGVPMATKTVGASYGAFHIVSALNGAILFGWILLAVGAYRSGVFGWLRAISFGLMSALMMGVLKGSSATSVVAVTGLCIALVPEGVRILRMPPSPPLRTVIGWTALVACVATALFVLGQLG